MKIGASTLASNNLEEFLDLCSSLNLDYVEIVKTFPNHDFDKSLLEKVQTLIDLTITEFFDENENEVFIFAPFLVVISKTPFAPAVP